MQSDDTTKSKRYHNIGKKKHLSKMERKYKIIFVYIIRLKE